MRTAFSRLVYVEVGFAQTVIHSSRLASMTRKPRLPWNSWLETNCFYLKPSSFTAALNCSAASRSAAINNLYAGTGMPLHSRNCLALLYHSLTKRSARLIRQMNSCCIKLILIKDSGMSSLVTSGRMISIFLFCKESKASVKEGSSCSWVWFQIESWLIFSTTYRFNCHDNGNRNPCRHLKIQPPPGTQHLSQIFKLITRHRFKITSQQLIIQLPTASSPYPRFEFEWRWRDRAATQLFHFHPLLWWSDHLPHDVRPSRWKVVQFLW